MSDQDDILARLRTLEDAAPDVPVQKQLDRIIDRLEELEARVGVPEKHDPARKTPYSLRIAGVERRVAALNQRIERPPVEERMARALEIKRGEGK